MKKAIATVVGLVILLVATPALAVETNYGHDVSWPQCSRMNTVPVDGAFKIVGVTGGLLYSTNSCLEAQLTWAGVDAELYLNTGNPGPNLSSRYTSGSYGGKTCYTSNKNSAACAFVYGYRGAADAYARAKTAFTNLGLSNLNDRTWWLDVERVNSWRGLDNNLPSDSFLTATQAQSLNVANLQGAVYYLESVVKVKRLGFYSVTSHWNAITGGTTAFSDHETWMAVGQDGEQAAINECLTTTGFTGAPETRVQYIDTALDLDVNVPCTIAKASTAVTYSGSKSVHPSRTMTLKATLKTALGTPMANRTVSIVFNKKTYTLTTNSSGIASKSITAPKYRGTYRVSLSYAGNDLFIEKAATGYVKVYW